VGDEMTILILQEGDLLDARRCSRELALSIGFEGVSLTLIATAISELARNILNYAGSGEIRLSAITDNGRQGLQVVAHDEGPGIVNTELAMKDGYSTGGGLGLGLPGTKRLMDDFELTSALGRGTTVTTVKWLKRAS
jgi:serine/threonine-protein kinase RsbT